MNVYLFIHLFVWYIKSDSIQADTVTVQSNDNIYKVILYYIFITETMILERKNINKMKQKGKKSRDLVNIQYCILQIALYQSYTLYIYTCKFARTYNLLHNLTN